jgi:hypothetical protein
MKRFTIALIATLFVLPLGAGAQTTPGTATCDLDTILEELSTQHLRKKEKNNLLFMREEEKLARDVYLSLYEEWGLRIFRQISRSERTHMASALVLIEKYELEDPVGDNPLGVFTNEDLQALYEDLSAAGQSSLVSALIVGALIEELDIYDLQRVSAKTNNDDLKILYQNLMKGSRNHLRAFTDVLEGYGESYEPTFLSEEEYGAILDSSKERGLVGVDGEPLCG